MTEAEYYTQKREKMSELYNLTKQAAFSGIEDEVDDFAAYVEQRQQLFDALAAQDAKYSDELSEDLARHSALTNVSFVDINSIKSDIKRMSSEILKVDEAHNAKMKRVMALVSDEIKKMQSGKMLNNKYQGNNVPLDGGSFFDSKN